MKLLLVFIFMLSCGKGLDHEERKVLENNYRPKTQALMPHLKGNFDLFVSFYWPKNFKVGDKFYEAYKSFYIDLLNTAAAIEDNSVTGLEEEFV